MGTPLWQSFVPLPTAGNAVFRQQYAPKPHKMCGVTRGGTDRESYLCHIYIPLPIYRDIIWDYFLSIWVVYIGFIGVSADMFIHVASTHGYVSYTPHMKCTDAYIIYIT